MKIIVLMLGIMFLVGPKMAAFVMGFSAIGLAFLVLALRWPEEESTGQVDETASEAEARDFGRTAAAFLRKLRQRFLSMQEV